MRRTIPHLAGLTSLNYRSIGTDHWTDLDGFVHRRFI